MRRIVWLLAVVACGGSSGGGGAPATSTTNSAVTKAPAVDDGAEQRARQEREEREEREKKDALSASHREIELEQQNAMAASCSEPKPWNKHERCMPSCYPTEEPDKRADQKLAGATESEHIVCRRSDEVPYVVVDEIGGAKLRVKTVRGRLPRAHPKSSWQAAVETWFRDEQAAKLPRADVVVVKDKWRNRSHPLSREKLSCVTISHIAKARGKLDECGAVAKSGVTCEAVGNGAARAINVAHYRVAEAKRLHAAGKAEACQQAALETVAIARGLPRWRQYKKLNVDEWNDKLIYKTRFDGMLDEDGLFAVVAALGAEAEALHASCGGSGAATKVEQEQSFHTCW